MALVHLSSANFDDTIAANKVVLVDFWANWCGPCKMLAPVLDQVAAEMPNVCIGKVDVDENQELAQRFGVASIPTLVYFKNGKVVDMSQGLTGKDAIKAVLNKLS